MYASTALMDPMTKAFVADIHGFVAARGLELVSFAKGQRKDDLAQQFLARFTERRGGAVRRPGPGEGRGVAHPAPLQPVDRGQLRLAGALVGVHQLLLLLLRGRRLRPVLPQVRHLLPLHRQAVHQRQRVGQTAGREGRDDARSELGSISSGSRKSSNATSKISSMPSPKRRLWSTFPLLRSSRTRPQLGSSFCALSEARSAAPPAFAARGFEMPMQATSSWKAKPARIAGAADDFRGIGPCR